MNQTIANRVSVIIPAFDAVKTVGAAVDSVLAQTFNDVEVLVIDDGSRDSTADVVRSRLDPRVRCETTINGGVARARNRGIELATGDLVAFLDADDVWHPRKLERQLELMTSRPAVGLCFTSALLVDDQLRVIGQDPAPGCADFTEALLVTGNILSAGASSVVVRRPLLETCGGFDPPLSQCADWDLWLRLSLETEFASVVEPLVSYRQMPGTMSSKPELLERDTFALLDKFYATPGSAPYRHLRGRAYGNQWMICSGTYLHARRLKDAIRCVIRGLQADPHSIRRPLLLPLRFASRARSRAARTQAPERANLRA